MHAPTQPVNKRLYYHQTDGGAEYLTDSFVLCDDGHPEGCFSGAQVIVRLDGEPEVCGPLVDAYPDLLAFAKQVVALYDAHEDAGARHILKESARNASALIAKAEAQAVTK